MREMTLKAARKASGDVPSRLYTCAGYAARTGWGKGSVASSDETRLA